MRRLSLIGRWLARLRRATALWATAILLLTCRQAWPVDGIVLNSAASLSDTPWKELWEEYPESAGELVLWTAPPPYRDWTIDYRFRALFSSSTSYEFGTPDSISPPWAPLSKLSFPLNSFWHGLRMGLERPKWNLHCEWMMPQQGIQQELTDYDWQLDHAPFTDLGLTPVKWIEGQMLDVGLDFQWTDHISDLPVEVWPTFGFRWQRLNIMGYDLAQVKADGEWLDPPDCVPGDVIAFKQQYFVTYVGGQLRTKMECAALPPALLTFQGDWGYTSADNRDHHLLRDGERLTLETTWGGAWHVGLTAEVLLNKRFSLGFQLDHMDIITRGKHRWLNVPEGQDETTYNGVSVKSHQSSIVAFARLRI